MVLGALTLSFPHLREAERVEHGGVLVDVVVEVRRVCRGGEECILRDERPVVERDVLHRLARQAD